MQKEEKHIISPWITLAILSSLGIIAIAAETMVLPAIPDFIDELDISYEDSSWICFSTGYGSSYDSYCGQAIRYLW